MLKTIFIRNASDDTIQNYTPKALNIFVGPNNSGKSLLLREIYRDITDDSSNFSPILVDGTELSKVSDDKITDILVENDEKNNNSSEYHLLFYDRYGNAITGMAREHFFMVANGTMSNYKDQIYRSFKKGLASNYVMLLNGATRLLSMDLKEFSTRSNRNVSNPVNTLLNKKELFQKLREYIFDAFNLYLEIFLDGGNANFVLSKKSLPKELRLSVKPEATDFLLENSYDETNTSDGRKAYLGILSEIIAGDPRLLLLDEPEAFLHPPLARKLGNVISKLVSNGEKQVFISTHSADFIMGCIESHVQLNIVRLTYENEQSTFKEIDNKILEKIMNNPLLKSTNILKAIFYQKVIVTESDSDRAFYEEINSRLLEYKPEWGITDCLFVNAQNKQTTGIIVKTLREIGVPTVAIVDLDFIKEGGGEFTDKYLNPVNIPTTSHSGFQGNRTVLKDAFDNLQKENGNLKPEIIKVKGLDALKQVDSAVYETANDFIDSLNRFGFFPVRKGELESWLKKLQIKGHGSKWLTAVFEKIGDNPNSEEFVKPTDDDVWEFIGQIKHWFEDPNKRGMN